jgi:MoxR-like ATPase
MKKVWYYLKPVKNDANGEIFLFNPDASKSDIYIREDMIRLALENGQCIAYNIDTQRAYRKDMSEFVEQYDYIDPVQEEMKKEKMKELDPVVSFIHNEAVGLRPKELVMSDLRWKYLVRSAMRSKNIMMTGPAGCGKTMAAKMLVEALDRPHFYFNLGATQDPRGTLIGNTHFNKETGTAFHESVFVKAIQTKDAIILMDEISRAHPEAWNILMTVLDAGQRYLRLDEHQDAPTIEVAEGVTFVATANIGNEYTATRAMDRALVDRFIVVEMETLNKEDESSLLSRLHPNLETSNCDTIAEIAEMTRKDVKSDDPKLSTAISTRLCVELAGLMEDGFTLDEGAEVAIYPFYDEDGGVDSERTFMKQFIQKFSEGNGEDIFNTEEENADNA